MPVPVPLVGEMFTIHEFVFTTFHAQEPLLALSAMALVSAPKPCARSGGLAEKPQPVPHCVMKMVAPPTFT